MAWSVPEATAIIEELTARTHEMLGTEYRDAAIDAAGRAEAAAASIDDRIQLVTSFPTTGTAGVLYLTEED